MDDDDLWMKDPKDGVGWGCTESSEWVDQRNRLK